MPFRHNDPKKKDSFLHRDIKEIIREQSEKLKKFIEDQERVSLDEFINYHSNSIDQFILKTEENESLRFMAGNFHIKYFAQNKFGFIVDLYFKDASHNWINKRSRNDNLDIELYLTEDAINTLKEHDQLEYPIEKPTHN